VKTEPRGETQVAIYQTAHYQVEAGGVADVLNAIVEFVDYVRAN
jgi:hypothetical protein